MARLGQTHPYLYDVTAGKRIYKPTPRSLTTAREHASKLAKRTGHVIEVRDDYFKTSGEYWRSKNIPMKTNSRGRRVSSKKTFAAKAIIMPNGKVKVFVSPGVMAKIRKVNPGNYPLRTPDVVHSFSKKSEADVSLRLAQRGGKILTGEVAKVGKGYQLRLWLKK